MDTRPIITRAEFETFANCVDAIWWQTGENLIHRPEVMNIEGWNYYGHSGNAKLTEAQQVLMMWSDLVGQVANGGFEQFVYNYRDTLTVAYRLIIKIEWPELSAQFDSAFREQAGSPENPELIDDSSFDSRNYAARREQMINQLAFSKTRWKPWARASERASYAQFSDTILQAFYDRAVSRGEILTVVERPIEIELPPNIVADAFDTWFYAETTRVASQQHIGGFIRSHRDQLCRLSD